VDRSDAILAGLLVIALLARGGAGRLERALRTPLPAGARMPLTGVLRLVEAVRTWLDPAGFPELFALAAQIVESPWARAAEASRDLVYLSPDVPPLDPAYIPAGRVFAAHAAFETRAGAAVYNYNVGNLTTARGDWYELPSDARKYASFNYPLQAAVAMVSRIRRLWPIAYRAAYSGAIDAYARGLVSGPRRYYESDPSEYARGMRAIAAREGWM
jgi:hypothetical protein